MVDIYIVKTLNGSWEWLKVTVDWLLDHPEIEDFLICYEYKIANDTYRWSNKAFMYRMMNELNQKELKPVMHDGTIWSPFRRTSERIKVSIDLAMKGKSDADA